MSLARYRVCHFDVSDTLRVSYRPVDGRHRWWLEQGIEMGRPSHIRLEVEVKGGAATGARIGDHAVKVAEGALYV